VEEERCYHKVSTWEIAAMLNAESLPSSALIAITDDERTRFQKIVPEDHFLRRLLQAIDFEGFRPLLSAAYCPDQGRPPLDPVILLKLEVLARQHRLSDREVIMGARFNIAYRLFLGLSLESPLPHHTSLTYFRQRLGPERMQQVFDALVGRARQLGLVKDRLRLKDATHIIANIAIPSTFDWSLRRVTSCSRRRGPSCRRVWPRRRRGPKSCGRAPQRPRTPNAWCSV
jgi:transposase